MKFGIKLQTPE